jgi:hypothetical protein
MDDIKYLLKKDTVEKKVTARSARKKVRHTGCNLPSDRMSKKEINKMNGEVFCVNIHQPMTWKHFKKLSNDIQREYLTYLSDEFSCRYVDLAKAFGISVAGFAHYLTRNGLKGAIKSNRWKRLKQQEWDVFWNSYTYSGSLEQEWDERMKSMRESARESLENDHSATNSADGAEVRVQHVNTAETKEMALEANRDNEKPSSTCKAAIFTSFTVALRDVQSWDEIPEYLSSIPISGSNIVTMQVAFTGYDNTGAGECTD